MPGFVDIGHKLVLNPRKIPEKNLSLKNLKKFNSKIKSKTKYFSKMARGSCDSFLHYKIIFDSNEFID